MGMARGYRRVDRGQSFLLPPDMSQWLPPGHLVWFVLDVVEELDVSVLEARYARGGAGRAAYDPRMLLALLVYAYATGQRSSRRIEALCVTDVAFRVICAQDVPDHTTIARFRAVHQGAFADLFTQVLVLCANAGMGRVGVVAIDGTKIAANASLGANRSQEWLAAQAGQIVAEAAAVDAAEDEQFGAERGDELAEKFADRAGRRARIRAALEQARAAEQRDQAQQDSDAAKRQRYLQRLRQGPAPRGGPPAGLDRVEVEQARIERYTQRLGVSEHGSHDYHSGRIALAAARRRLADELARRAQGCPSAPGTTGPRTTESTTRANITDPDSRIMKTRQGWVQGYNAQLAVSEDHLILAAALTQDTTDTAWFEPMMTAAVAAARTIAQARGDGGADPVPERIGVLLADAGYLSNDNLTSDGPDRLIAIGSARQVSRTAREDPASGPPPAHSTPTRAMAHRLRTPEAAKMYRRRAATVEPVNGHLKDQIGLRRFARRGLIAATSELHLAAAVTNLLKLHHRQALATG